MPIIEITGECDLACPICLVGNRASTHLSPADIERILDGLIASEGEIAVLNLSGGEPTRNPRFREIVDACLAREEILRVSVSTNGLALGADPSLLGFLAERDVVVSLQFDGFSDDAYVRLRGRPLLREKLALIERAAALDAPMSLTATIAAGINEAEIGAIAEFLFEHDHILSAMFQPMAYEGRGAEIERPARAVGIPDVVAALDGTRGGRIRAADFSPLPCSHPACFSLAYYLRLDGGAFLPVKGLVDIDRYLDMIQNRALFGTDAEGLAAAKAAVYDLWSGPTALAPDSRKALSAVKRLLAAVTCCGGSRGREAVVAAERSIKSIFIHAFMDAYTFDIARARKCCNVYPAPDGRLLPACVRNVVRR